MWFLYKADFQDGYQDFCDYFLDLTRPILTSQWKGNQLTLCTYMAVYYRVLPLSMLRVSKSYEIPYHLANSWENFVSQMMCISTCRSWPLPELKQMMKGVCMETHCCCWCKNTCSYISVWSIRSGTNLKKNSCHWKTN